MFQKPTFKSRAYLLKLFTDKQYLSSARTQLSEPLNAFPNFLFFLILNLKKRQISLVILPNKTIYDRFTNFWCCRGALSHKNCLKESLCI